MTGGVHTTRGRRRYAWGPHRLEQMALGIGLVPVVVAAVWAVATRWAPTGDAAYYAARSLDVFTGHHPFIGVWSMGSVALDEPVNSLGPLQLDALAPFTRVSPYAGAAVGSAAINAASVVGVWLAARRMLAATGVIAAMAATVAVQATFGGLVLVDPRPQFAMLLPFWCYLWVTAAAWMGVRWALPAAVFIASFIVQSHLSYTYLVAFGGGAAGVMWLVNRDRQRRLLPPVLAAVGAAAVAWMQPLWDELFRSGNLSRVVSSRGSGEPLGWTNGVHYMAHGPMTPTFFLPGSVADFHDAFAPWPEPRSALLSFGALAAWCLVLAGCGYLAIRIGHRALMALTGTSAVVLVSGVYTTARLPSVGFGFVPQNYLWLWPLFAFVATTAGLGAWTWWRAHGSGELHGRDGDVRGGDGGPRRRFAAVLIAIVVVAMAAPAFRQTGVNAHERLMVDHGMEFVRTFDAQLTRNLQHVQIAGPVLLDHEIEGLHAWRHAVVVTLRKAGVDFRFDPGNVNLLRYGLKRCVDGTATQQIVVRVQAEDWEPQPGATVLAQGEPLSPDDRRRLEEMRGAFGDHLRGGALLDVDIGGFTFFKGDELGDQLAQVAHTPGQPLSGLEMAQALDLLRGWGDTVNVDRQVRSELAEWAALEERDEWTRTVAYIEPLEHPPIGWCSDPIRIPGRRD